MKIIFYQTKDETLSINLLFNVIRQNLPGSLDYSILYFSYTGASLFKRIKDVVSCAFKTGNHISHITGDFNYAAYFMPKSSTVLTIHDLYRLYTQNSSSLKAFIFKWCWLQIPVLRSTVVTAVSQTTKNEILKYIQCPPEKIRVIYNCISAGFTPVPKKFNKQKPVLLQVGTRPNKNMARLVKAIAGINCRLEIIGEPSAEIITLLENHNIDYNWKSNLSGKQVIQKYIECDIVALVSTFEGFGLPIVEANAVERVVVTSCISAMPEIAGTAACLVDPYDIESICHGIMRVIQDDGYRENLIAEGRINKERFEAQKIAGEYYALYQELYAGKINY